MKLNRIVNKLALFVFLFTSIVDANAQFTDPFQDSNLSNRWLGEVSKFRVNNNQELQLAASGAGTAYISRNYSLQDSTVWESYIRMEFDPSTSNRLRWWLASDSEDIDTGNGYYIEIGENGNGDAIRLFRKTGSARTLLASGTAGAVALANVVARIRVILTTDRIWSLSVDYTGNQIFQQEFQFSDPGFALNGVSLFFGYHCTFTATRTDLFFFDDAKVDLLRPDEIPPRLTNFTIIPPNRITLAFNEPINSELIQAQNFQLTPAAGSVNFSVGVTSVELNFSLDFVNRTSYSLTIRNIADLAGNVAPDTVIQFNFLLIEAAEAYDILFTEIMARPSPPQGLPNAEYFELYNRSQKSIDLASLEILDGSTLRAFDTYILEPESFVIICSRTNKPIFEVLGPTSTMASMPALTIAGKKLILQRKGGLLIDYIDYNESWYQDRIKRNGGYSLELINPNAPCRLQSNWRGSDDPRGGTPGSRNSVWAPSLDQESPVILHVYPESGDQLLLTYSKKLSASLSMKLDAILISPTLDIDQVIWNPVFPDQLTVILGSEMESGQLYTISSLGIQDCIGLNHEVNITRQVGVPEPPRSGDIIINEVLFQAETGGSRFVELKNISTKVVDVFPLFIADFSGNTPDGFRIERRRILLPGQIAAFTTDPDYISNRYAPPAEASILNARIPTLSDREGNVTIYTFQANERIILDALNYSRDFHYALLRDRRGISIERINPEAPTQDRNNWHSAAEAVGYATPGYENSQFRAPSGLNDGQIFFEDKFFSPDGDGFKDFLQINYELSRPGYVATVRIFDSEGRMMRNLIRSELLGAQGSFKWDGTNDAGGICRMGIYVVLAELVEPGGDVIRFKEDCVLGGRF